MQNVVQREPDSDVGKENMVKLTAVKNFRASSFTVKRMVW